MVMRKLWAPQVRLESGWAQDVLIECDGRGQIAALRPDCPETTLAPTVERLRGPVLPGLVNVHSHAFQRAMAGFGDAAAKGRAGPPGDNFWTWREVMYRFLATLGPADVEAIATWLYIELLRCGFTTVVEFHYLHHDPSGRPYADRLELSTCLLRAAERAGIALTLLPVFYAHSGFGGAPPTEGQRRFVHDVDGFLRLYDDLAAHLAGRPSAVPLRLGIAPHSLRAVTPDELSTILAHVQRVDPRAPVHIHAAEQPAEVSACQASLGAPPVAWLLDHVGLDARFCLIHATHMTADECQRLARSGAVAGVCPTTEANLGDGLFSAPSFLAAGGRLAIGTDSHVGVDPFAELRLLEYGQRLTSGRRGVLSLDARSVAATLFDHVARAGAQAADQPTSRITVGARADLLVLDADHPDLAGRHGDALLDALVFAPSPAPCLIRDVYVASCPVVTAHQHPAAAPAAQAYKQALTRLT
ncbi:MAG TPA: formimidoylglutamate deiminase [Pseudomonadota bacterium]|nr:formimidoylglutamate deiminase [Pseudomonadota bacterium]